MSDENNTFENNNQEVNGYYNAEPQGPQKGEGQGLGIAAMVCGILAIVTICCVPYGPIILGIIAIILGIVQIVKNQKKGMAIAGIVCGGLGLVAYIAIIIFGVYLFTSGVYQEIIEEFDETGVYSEMIEEMEKELDLD